MEQVGDEALSAVAGGVPAMSPAMLDKMYLKKYLPDLYEKLQQEACGISMTGKKKMNVTSRTLISSRN